MDPERKLIASDAETGEYGEGTVLYLSDSTLAAGYRASFISAVEVLSVSLISLHCVVSVGMILSKVTLWRRD